ncbi:hypothetical protein AB0O67_08115 [Streptomyces sp. NPDC086077]|uniref:hypothetical protein n=1 Tax=Streptomyces sp. NPDC086077 TaxID=3154862 RepID=UPI0034334A98
MAGDLDRNVKEQERLSGEIEALQAQLTALRHDHTVLVNIQQALGVPAPATPSAEPAATVPAPRKTRKTAATSTAAKQTKAKKPAAPTRKRSDKKSPAKAPATSPTSPTLVELVRAHLEAQGEPRSAAEVTTALGEQHPERSVKTTVVRTTLEGLVARNQAQRSKQGSSVFYTTPEAAEPAAQAEELAQQGE